MFKKIITLLSLIFSNVALAFEYDITWANDTIRIHRTVGNRGQDVFESNLCISKLYTPPMSSSGDEYIPKNKSFVFRIINNELLLITNSTDYCLPDGIYTRID